MSAFTRFLRDSTQLNTAEFAARIYPDKSRATATSRLSNHLRSTHDTPEAIEARDLAAQQVQQLVTALRAGLAAPRGAPDAEARQLVALATDKRLVGRPLALAIFTDCGPVTATMYWTKVRNGSYVLLPPETARLRAELTKLADLCEKAIK